MHSLTSKKRGKKSKHARNEEITCYLMILPTLIGFVLFSLYPISWALRYAFYDYNGTTAFFVGMENFIRIFTRDPAFWEALVNTFILTFGKLAIEIPLALFLAITVTNKLRGSSVLRTIYFMPNIISMAVVGLIFFFMFDTSSGIVNSWLVRYMGVAEPINWFGAKWTSMLVIAIVSIWQGFGINMMFLMSGVQGIPAELYECANLDGAGKMRTFFSITLPMLAPVLRTVLMLAMVGTMQTTDLVLVLTNGAPAGKTEVMMTYIFKLFFNYGSGSNASQYGYATACSLVFAIILGVFTIFYLRMSNKAKEI